MSAPDLTADQMQTIDRMSAEVDSGTLYGLLSVSPDADANEIQQAYYQLSRRWHPDRFFRKETGDYGERIETVFVALTQAYKTLTDPARRKRYDRDLREAGIDPRGWRGRTAGPKPSPSARPADATAAGAGVAGVGATATTGATPSNGADATRAADASPDAGRRRGGPSVRERLQARGGRRPSPRSHSSRQRIRSKVQAQVSEQLEQGVRKAITFFQAGKADYAAGQVIRASSSLALAVEFDPSNDEYRELYEKVKDEARVARIGMLIVQGEQAESYQQLKQAIHAYRQALELDPDEGKVFYRLARLVRLDENDDREALNLLRQAVLRSPGVADYRLALGELYKELGMRLNAKREFQTILDADKGHEAAKAALKEL